LPPLLCTFAEQHEQVSVELHVADARSIVEAVFANEIELGFVGGRWSRAGLDFDPLTVDELVFIAATGHPLAKRKRLKLADLAAVNFIAQEPGSGQRMSLEHELQERGFSIRDLKLVADLGNQESVKAAVLAGHGVGCVWRGSVQAELALGSLHVLEVADFAPDNAYYAVHRTHRRLTRVCESFLRDVRAVAERVR
jgi:DNA-binding transcriptional LysR family regulator